MKKVALVVLGACLLSLSPPQEKPTLTIGSKMFPESYILAEIAAQIAESTGEARVIRKLGMGGTEVVYTALESGAIDLYPEYTGTLSEVILKTDKRVTIPEINAALAPKGLEITNSLGFNDSYALAMLEDVAKERKINKISDLKNHPDVVAGFSHEFLNRKDGYLGLRQKYGFEFAEVRGLQHSLAYVALLSQKIHVMDVYTTDGKLTRFKLRILEDDQSLFPDYSAVFLYRADIAKKLPRTFAKLQALEGKINQSLMMAMNAKAEVEKQEAAQIASAFLESFEKNRGEIKAEEILRLKAASSTAGIMKQTFMLGGQHLTLVAISLFFAIFIGIPLGITAFYYRRAGQGILAITGIVQTIPSLALFCFLIPLVGIGATPAILALFLYSLLPIVRSTFSGLQDIDPRLNESATALGLSTLERLFLIQIPLASRSILSGVKTSAIINVGTATLAALIGAGGFGEPIITGLSLLDIPTILSGAIPVSLLAILVHGIFEVLDVLFIPKGLRLKLR